MDEKKKKRWVQVKDFYLYTDKDEKGIKKYLNKLRTCRANRIENSILLEKELQIFND